MTAAPGQHGVHEITFVIQGGGRAVFFGGDSLRVPELDTIPDRFDHVDMAILPTNGLCIRPMNLQQVVMNADEAAGLTAVLNPTLAVPHHYAFHSGWLGDRMITKGDRDPRPATLRRRGRADRPEGRRPPGPARNSGDSPVSDAPAMTAISCPRSAATSRPASGPRSPSSGPSPATSSNGPVT